MQEIKSGFIAFRVDLIACVRSDVEWLEIGRV